MDNDWSTLSRGADLEADTDTRQLAGRTARPFLYVSPRRTSGEIEQPCLWRRARRCLSECCDSEAHARRPFFDDVQNDVDEFRVESLIGTDGASEVPRVQRDVEDSKVEKLATRYLTERVVDQPLKRTVSVKCRGLCVARGHPRGSGVVAELR